MAIMRTQRKRRKRAFTLIELAVVMAILCVLAGLLLSALAKARENGHCCQCQNNLRQIGLAFLQYESVTGALPATEHPWTIVIGPFSGLEGLAGAYDTTGDPWTPTNAPLGKTSPPLFRCPSSPEVRLEPSGWVASNCAANIEILGRCNTIARCTDGASHTCLAVEISSALGLPYVTGPVLIPGVEQGNHCGVFNALMLDGSVHSLATNVSDVVMQALATPDSGDISPSSF